MKQIELKTKHGKALYHSKTRIVTHCTRSGVMCEFEMPSNWALTRIFQFMDSLLLVTNDIV